MQILHDLSERFGVAGVEEVVFVFEIAYTSTLVTEREVAMVLTSIDIADNERCQNIVRQSLHRLERDDDRLDCHGREGCFDVNLMYTAD